MSDRTFFSFRRAPDWARGFSMQLEHQKDGYSIVREKVYRHQSRYQLASSEHIAGVTNTAADSEGRWYVLDEQRTVWRMDAASRYSEKIIQLEENAGSPTYIAAAGEAVVISVQGESSRLEALQIDKSQIRWTTDNWYEESFHIQAIAPDHSGGWLAIATLGAETELQLLRFDVSGLPAYRIPLDAAAVDNSAGEAEPHMQSGSRFQIVLGKSPTCWIMDRYTQQLIEVDLLRNYAALSNMDFLPDSCEMISLCCTEENLLWLLLAEKQDRNVCSLLALNAEGAVMKHGYTGNAAGELLIAGHSCLYIWNADQRLVFRIVPVSEPAVWKATGSRMGIWISEALDSGEAETQWHRLVLQATRQNDTQMNIRYYASDSREIWLGQERTTIERFLADERRPIEERLALLAPYWSTPLKDPQDALIHKAKGRYLWLYVELIGSANNAPGIRSMEVYFPRQSYLDYLPALYQQDEHSSDFLSRYLSIFQTMIEQVDDSIQGVTRILEANQVTGSSLRWLLGWLGIETEDDWSDEQLRKLLKAAPQLYSLRGTKAALERLIEIYTGEKPIILEYEQVKPLKENVELGEVADRLYAAEPHMFNVLVKAETVDTELKRVSLQQLIDAYKPAFATFKLIILQPWVYMDLHSYLGMNTILSEPTLLTLDGRSSMPHHTITIDVGQENRMDQHTRLGLNSRLE